MSTDTVTFANNVSETKKTKIHDAMVFLAGYIIMYKKFIKVYIVYLLCFQISSQYSSHTASATTTELLNISPAIFFCMTKLLPGFEPVSAADDSIVMRNEVLSIAVDDDLTLIRHRFT